MKNNHVNSKYIEDEVIRSFRLKRDIKISGNSVYLLTGKDSKSPRTNDLGNGSHGKIDFLVNYCGYKRVKVDNFPKNLSW